MGMQFLDFPKSSQPGQDLGSVVDCRCEVTQSVPTECFKRNWSQHGGLPRPKNVNGLYNSFPSYSFLGTIRPVYPLLRCVLRTKIDILGAKGQEAMRMVCRLAREVLDIMAAEIKPGVTTDYLDEICHKACIERDSYPSPLNYNHFPKSLYTSRILLDGDIINFDISLYRGGYHAGVDEAYYVGDRAKADPSSVRVVETTRDFLDMALELVKPGTPILELGRVIEKHARSRNCNGGHGINTEFYLLPRMPHMARTSQWDPRLVYWPDDWTNVTADGKRTAQSCA
ncbi:peptidase M24, structural domain-containing protein [Aspergillus terricola var. indicus]